MAKNEAYFPKHEVDLKVQGLDDDVHYSYGLHKRCSSVTGGCEDFPQYKDCQGHDANFCGLWRTVGFLMSFAIIIEMATLIAYAVIILGGKQKRDFGWKVVCSLLALGAMVQCASMAIVVSPRISNRTDKASGCEKLIRVLGVPL